MSYMLHQTEGFILARHERGEADRVLQLYTKTYGGVTLIAKGVRFEKSKLRGAVDALTRSHIGFIAGREVYRLTHAELLDAHTHIRQDMMRYRAAGHIADVFRRSVADGQADAGLWGLLEETFRLLNGDKFQEDQLHAYVLSFEVQFLKQLGYLPSVLPRVAHTVAEMTPHDLRELSLFLRPLLQYAAVRKWEDREHVSNMPRVL